MIVGQAVVVLRGPHKPECAGSTPAPATSTAAVWNRDARPGPPASRPIPPGPRPPFAAKEVVRCCRGNFRRTSSPARLAEGGELRGAQLRRTLSAREGRIGSGRVCQPANCPRSAPRPHDDGRLRSARAPLTPEPERLKSLAGLMRRPPFARQPIRTDIRPLPGTRPPLLDAGSTPGAPSLHERGWGRQAPKQPGRLLQIRARLSMTAVADGQRRGREVLEARRTQPGMAWNARPLHHPRRSL